MTDYLTGYLWHFRDGVPAGRGGRVYDSIEARCNACEIYGGKDEPCMSDHALSEYEAAVGRPCPRVLLEGDLLPALEIVQAATSTLTSTLAPAVAEAATAGLPDAARRKALLRAVAVLHSHKLRERVLPKTDKSPSSSAPRAHGKSRKGRAPRHRRVR